MRLIKCPEKDCLEDVLPRIFLAGGITNCADWQAEIITLFKDVDVVLIDPRRKDFDVTDPDMSAKQIEWEFEHLERCDFGSPISEDGILFWFPPETLCPITLFELGSHLQGNILVGCHPDYQRRFDVIQQLKHARPDVTVVDNIPALVEQVKAHLRSN